MTESAPIPGSLPDSPGRALRSLGADPAAGIGRCLNSFSNDRSSGRAIVRAGARPLCGEVVDSPPAPSARAIATEGGSDVLSLPHYVQIHSHRNRRMIDEKFVA